MQLFQKKNKLIVSENRSIYLMKICLKLVESQKKIRLLNYDKSSFW